MPGCEDAGAGRAVRHHALPYPERCRPFLRRCAPSVPCRTILPSSAPTKPNC